MIYMNLQLVLTRDVTEVSYGSTIADVNHARHP